MHVPITTYSIITIRWSTKGTWSGPYFRTNVINILINKLFSISEENITQFSEIVFKRSANKSYRKNVLLVFRLDMFEVVCLTNMPFVVWCMFEKSKINVSLAKVLKEVEFPWIIVSIVFILSLKSVINFDGLSL